jgi:hypothetical protein
MKRKVALEIICFLLVLLFVYAATNKIFDFQRFRAQIGQSPLLTAFAGSISVGIPVLELVIAGLLMLPKYRLIGLLASFSLMIMFTSYIIIILNFSPFIPCSCGGVLEILSWNQHLLFNMVFVGISLSGIILQSKDGRTNFGGIKKEI